MRPRGNADTNACTHAYRHYGGSSGSDSYCHGRHRTGNTHAYPHQVGRSPNSDSHPHASADSEPHSNPCGGPRS